MPPYGQQFPHRLQPDDECVSAIRPDLINALISPLGSDPAAKHSLRPEVQLGNGRKARGSALVLRALDTQPPRQP